MTDNGTPPPYPFDPQDQYGTQPSGAPGFGQNPYAAAPQPYPGQTGYPGQPPYPADVPERWRSRFDFFSRYGQPASSPESTAAFKQLSFGGRFRLGFNGPAFLFGPIYYAIKGPWRKGLSLLGIAIAISFVIGAIEAAFDFTIPAASYSVAIGLIYSSVANWAYFLHVTRGSTSWNPVEGMPMVRKKA